MKTTDQEYLQECFAEAARDVGKGLLIYAVLLAAYWTMVG